MPDSNLDALLEHSGWVRALAASLSRDPGLADDIVQETWISAMRRGPRDERSPRGWLATLLRRQLRQVRRGDERRARREKDHARALALASTAEVVERAESHRNLVQAVLDLREPFRSTVLLRYLEERTPEEIATRMGVPVSTVHSRLGRGLAALRERFGRDPDARPGLFGFLLWLRVGRPRASGRVLLQVAPRLALPALLLTTAGLGLWSLLASTVGPSRQESGVPVATALVSEPSRGAPAASGAARREAVALEPSVAIPSGASSASAEAALLLPGRVLDREGRAVAGVEIALEAATPDAEVLARSRSEVDGTFRFPPPSGPALLRARDAAFETVLAGVTDANRRAEVALVVAPRIAFAGRVVTGDGAPISGASVELWIDPYLPVSTAEALDYCRPVARTASSDESGRFRFESAPALREALLRVSHPGFETRNLRAPRASTGALELVLERPAGARLVRGVVRDELGRPAPGAIVSTATDWAMADGDGRFELVQASGTMAERLVAVQPGGGATVLELPAPLPEWLALDLSRRSGTITGSVRDARGQPVPGARVWLADPTAMGEAENGPRFAEALRVEPAAGLWHWVESDADGAFRIAGLFERSYRLRAADPRTLVLSEAVTRPGEHVVLVLSEERETARLSGRVVDDTGRALAGVVVKAARSCFQFPGAQRTHSDGLALPCTRTDAEGRFTLGPCALAETLLHVEGDAILPMAYALAELEGYDDLCLTASRRAHFRVELAPPLERADSIGLLSADEAEILLVQLREGCSHYYPRAPLAGGRSLVFAAPETARSLVFYKGEEEVGRLALALRPGELSVLGW